MSYQRNSFNSPRSSPFRRPASPQSPQSGGRPNTPPTNRSGASPMTSPSKLKHAYTVSEEDDDDDEELPSTPSRSYRAQTEPPPSPTTRRLPQSTSSTKFDATPSMLASPAASANPQPARRAFSSTLSQNDNLSKLPPQLLHSMRESFSVLDAAGNGTIDSASVSDTLHSLGLQETNMAQFFPPGQPAQLSLPQYLNQLANILVQLSPQQELLNAFSAFDDDDSGQIDVAELRTALLTTAPDPGQRPLTDRDIERAVDGFTGRRMLSKGTSGISGVRGMNAPAPKRGGDVFRYQEFVANLTGGPGEQRAGG